jgi:hypothetical protein
VKNHLIYRFVLFNVAFIAIAAALAVEGWVTWVFANDASYISYAITALFVVGWGWSAKEILVASSDLNHSAIHGPRPAALADADKDLGKIAWLSDIREELVNFGLLGTLVGFVIALSGIDQDTVTTADGAQNAVTALLSGMGTAIGTTIIGMVLASWLGVNLRILNTALNTYWNNRLLARPDEHGFD